MLKNIKPRRKSSRNKDGGLTDAEKALAAGFLDLKYQAQDITYVINQGRSTTINQARVTKYAGITPANADEVRKFLKIQASYDPKTLLNPYKEPRLIKAREAMMAAVQLFNSPLLKFKTELFCVLANIAWTYLLHEKLERTKKGSSIIPGSTNSVTVDGTLDKADCPVKDKAVIENLRAVIKIRHEVEHSYFEGGDDYFGPLFQACCVNFDRYLCDWFGKELSLQRELSLALQFLKLDKAQAVALEKSDFPPKIQAICKEIETSQYANENTFKLNIYFTAEITGKSAADLHLLQTHDPNVATAIVAGKVIHYKKIQQADLIKLVRAKGFKKFNATDHQNFWKTKWASSEKRNKDADKKFGEVVMGNMWLWYEQTWLPEVLKYCDAAGAQFK